MRDDVEVAKTVLDFASVGAVLGWLADILPGAATALTVIWMLIRIWETDTVKGWTGRSQSTPPTPPSD